MLYCDNLIKLHNCEKAVRYIIKYKVPNYKSNYDKYLTITKEILKSTNVSIETYSMLREMLYKLVNFFLTYYYKMIIGYNIINDYTLLYILINCINIFNSIIFVFLFFRY